MTPATHPEHALPVTRARKRFYSGTFCNVRDDGDERPADEPLDDGAFPFLRAFLESIGTSCICLGAALLEVELDAGTDWRAPTDAALARAALTHPAVLGSLDWALASRGDLERALASVRTPTLRELKDELGALLHHQYQRTNARTRVECNRLGRALVSAMTGGATQTRSVRILHVRHGWSDWFANDSGFDVGYLTIRDERLWVLAFTETD